MKLVALSFLALVTLLGTGCAASSEPTPSTEGDESVGAPSTVVKPVETGLTPARFKDRCPGSLLCMDGVDGNPIESAATCVCSLNGGLIVPL